MAKQQDKCNVCITFFFLLNGVDPGQLSWLHQKPSDPFTQLRTCIIDHNKNSNIQGRSPYVVSGFPYHKELL